MPKFDSFLTQNNNEVKDEDQLKSQNNIFKKTLGLQGLLGKGIHQRMERMKQLLEMKEL